ncbi:MICAL-like protein 1 isoform X2 [Dunckerocampus dactyliophorus]|uniref:MICAL-like protein 1 isoform X2 n=1 Tax=Dunckerocampus dactyliophorus TaxID=161453 RepID=UPI00240672F1|nr:MICAL-like protein 1 isoform X2 [Dunckerocampus dactyliophorus]
MRATVTHDMMASSQTLLQWCRQTCSSYPNVEIQNLSSSFRDGLAFCAIINKHRPDLIDFSSLSRAHIYENNQLAFAVAETKLGIPAFLVPKDMVATQVPDYLSVITYISQYYHYFSRASNGSSSLRSSHISLSNKSSTALPSGRDEHCPGRRRHTMCHFCVKPVHLIQRHVIQGEVYHRNCFRCKVCHSTLVAGFYTPGKAACSVICYDHLTNSAKSRHDETLELWQGCLSLGGLTLISVPEETQSHDRLVYKPVEQTVPRESSVSSSSMFKPPSPQPAPPGVDEATSEESGNDESPAVLADPSNEETKKEAHSELCSSCLPVTSKSDQLAPKQTPQPSHTGSASVQRQSSHIPSHVQKNPVKTNHPWLGIIHPGPWTQLPPVESPGPFRHSKCGLSWYRPRVPPPNPFSEDLHEDTKETQDVHDEDTSQPASSNLQGMGNVMASDHNLVLPRSISVPAVKSACPQTSGPNDMTDDDKPDSSSQNKVCKEQNHFDTKTEMPKSRTCQTLPSGRCPAPGHGFPLIKRKVQADQDASAADLQVETRQLNKQLEALEQRGIDMERNLRQCKNDKEEEQLLTKWLALIQERDSLMRRDTELVYLIKQQKLEERQADVEYELRRLLNKPESVWSEEDKSREQSLMAELVVVIEQRNQIVSILDQDRQRERKEDALWEVMTKNEEFEKEGLKELKKTKGKFKPSKVFKKLNQKEHTKESADKKC